MCSNDLFQLLTKPGREASTILISRRGFRQEATPPPLPPSAAADDDAFGSTPGQLATDAAAVAGRDQQWGKQKNFVESS